MGKRSALGWTFRESFIQRRASAFRSWPCPQALLDETGISKYQITNTCLVAPITASCLEGDAHVIKWVQATDDVGYGHDECCIRKQSKVVVGLREAMEFVEQNQQTWIIQMLLIIAITPD